MIGKKRIIKKGTFLFTTVFFVIAFSNLSCKEVISRSDFGEEKQQEKHPANEVIPDFHLYSYYAGRISTSTEFVSYGCKKLALSTTLSDEELAVLLPHAEQKAKEYRIPIYVEKDLLVTPLFSPTVARGKTVILFAYNQDVLDEYFAIKAFREKAIEEGRLGDVEEELGWRFGRLLSYTDETIERLLSEEK
ncbi:MAG: hypothetical protein JSV17_12605 [Candidatus Aminicenantes bacterium]|nr:MAG: hypothetical protein JSV17_12605 [Candidatus Aminicenantes bacterium]